MGCSTLDPRVVPVEEGKDLSATNSHGPGSRKIGQLPEWDVRRAKVLVFSGCESHPATWSFWPVAVQAARKEESRSLE